MTLWQAFFLGLLQGITEFLPVSSSGHLVLAETFFGLQVKELLVFDVVLHFGTLIALFVYFGSDLWKMFKVLLFDLLKFVFHSKQEPKIEDSKNIRMQAWFLVIATLPIVFFGPFLKDIVEQIFRDDSMVVTMLLVTAFFLAIAEIFGKKANGKVSSVKVALLMGVFQVFAIVPGLSRSGSSIVGGLFGGLNRFAAARFSFLMAVPAIGGATVFLLSDLFRSGASILGVPFSALMLGFITSVVVSFFAMYGMMRFLQKRSLWVFVGYLVIVAGFWLVV